MRIAVYAGSFDPITLGHLSVIERASQLFDRVVVVIAVNPDKRPLFTVEERERLIRDAVQGLQNVACTSTRGMVVELAHELGAAFLVRGVRDTTDLDAEIELANLNRELAPEIATVFIPAEPTLSRVSSSRLKELALEGEDISAYCTPTTAGRLRQKLQANPPVSEVFHEHV